MSFEFTTTACCRPEIIERTYQSFSNNLLNVNFSKSILYINIDPIPKNTNPELVLDIAKKYFGEVIYNIPKSPNFTNALKWCWSKPKNKYFFHLEDDWILLKSIDINVLVKLINNKYVSVLLRGYKKDRNTIDLAPSLFSTEFANRISKKLNINYNPEEQIRAPIGSDIRISEPTDCTLRYPDEIVIKDIGREWLRNNNIKRNNTKDVKLFTGWSHAN